jgi:hypothetical protein
LVGEGVIADPHGLRDEDLLVRLDRLLVEGGGRHHDLVDRTGLVGVGHDAVPCVRHVDVVKIVRVERWIARHREHLARPRIERDEHPAIRLRRLHGFRERTLRRQLDVRVDRELEVPARNGGHLREQPLRDAAPARVLLEHAPAGSAPEDVVEAVLEAGQPVLVGPDEPHDVRRERAAGVQPPRLVEDPDARSTELLDLVRRDQADPAGEVHEACVLAQVGLDRRGVALEQWSESARGPGRIGDHTRVGVDRPGRDGHRELVPVAVEDRPAARRQLDLAQALPLGLLRVGLRAYALHVSEPDTDPGHADEERRAQSCRATQRDLVRHGVMSVVEDGWVSGGGRRSSRNASGWSVGTFTRSTAPWPTSPSFAASSATRPGLDSCATRARRSVLRSLSSWTCFSSFAAFRPFWPIVACSAVTPNTVRTTHTMIGIGDQRRLGSSLPPMTRS